MKEIRAPLEELIKESADILCGHWWGYETILMECRDSLDKCERELEEQMGKVIDLNPLRKKKTSKENKKHNHSMYIQQVAIALCLLAFYALVTVVVIWLAR